jgi:Flp pilus assembly protein TadG
MTKNHKARGKRAQRIVQGAAAVEFALIAPLFLLMLGGIIEFGQAFRIEHLLSNACRRGARSAIFAGSSTGQVQANVQNQCVKMLGVNSADVAVTVLVNGNNADVSSAVKGDQIDVQVTIPFSKAGVSFFSRLFFSSNLSSTCILEHE